MQFRYALNSSALFSKFATVIRATVKGTIVVAVLQGALGGLIFWFLGIRAALLWAVLMAFLSLLPAVGAAFRLHVRAAHEVSPSAGADCAPASDNACELETSEPRSHEAGQAPWPTSSN